MIQTMDVNGELVFKIGGAAAFKPCGDAIEMRSEWDYIIYEHLLRKWIAERSEENG